jgi:transposase
MANGNVDGGAPLDLSAGGGRISERSAGCRVGAARAADPQGVAGRATAQNRHAGGDLPRDSFPLRSTVYNIFRKFQRDGVWEAIWAELHMGLRERMGREASPSAAVLDSQSVKSAEKGAAKTTRWVTTPLSR